MNRTINNALKVLALAAVVIVGCGKEDLTDLNDKWVAKDNEVNKQLMDLKAKQTALQDKYLSAQPVADPTDTVAVANRAAVDQMLQNHMTKVGEIELKLAEWKTKRDSAMAKGSRSEYETAWKAAEVEYEAALTELKTLDSQLGDLEAKIGSLGKANTTTRDSAGAAAPKTTDSATATGVDATNGKSTTTDAKTSETTPKEGAVTVDGKQVGRVDVNVKDKEKPAVRVEIGKEDGKPLIEKNKNP